MEDNIHASYIALLRKGLLKILTSREATIFLKELSPQTSYFWGETIHFFWQFKKQSIYFQQGGKQFIYFEQNGKHFIYFHIFLTPPPPPRYQMVRP